MRLRSQQGQVTTLAAVFMLSVLALGALVVDAGAWFHAHRSAQAAADAAALAGAQALPDDPATARALALDYADENGGGLAAGDISVSPQSDKIWVEVDRPAPTFFSRVLGFEDFTVTARAGAGTGGLAAARYAAPIVVDEQHPYLAGPGCPCFGSQTTLDLQKTGPGAFRLVNLDGSRGGTSPATLAEWMRRGFEGEMGLGWYYSDPGAKFNSSHMQGALRDRTGSDLLFPVYRSVRGNGANLQYDVVAWVTFHLTGFDARGSSGELYGWFTHLTWDGIPASGGTPAYSAKSVSLIE